MKTLLTVMLFAPLAACALDPAETDAASPAPCVAAGEVAPRRIAVNGVQSNGIQTNGIQANGVQLNGIQLNGVQLNGVALGAADLAVGAELTAIRSDGTSVVFVVAAAEQHEGVALHRLTSNGQNACAGDEAGLFVAGIWDEAGAWHASRGAANATFACRSSVIAKCALWGYAPWSAGPRAHQACTRMARADYCGTGKAWTLDGTAIDVFDGEGVLHATNDPAYRFEAGWNENGAVCVSRPRFDTHDARGDTVLPECWRDLPSCTSLAEAQAQGAVIANASRPQSRRVCE